MEKAQIKRIGEDMLAQCAKFVIAANESENEKFGFTNTGDSAPLEEKLRVMLEAGAGLFAAFDGEEMVAFCMIDAKDERAYEISNLCVSEPHRRKGYGQLMLDTACKEIAKAGATAAVGVINSENAPLKAWILKNGFAQGVSGFAQGIKCEICLVEKEITAEPQCSQSSACSSCNGCS